jgi:hypothetical protein
MLKNYLLNTCVFNINLEEDIAIRHTIHEASQEHQNIHSLNTKLISRLGKSSHWHKTWTIILETQLFNIKQKEKV